MAKKHVYFIRHGQSEYNLSDTMLPHDTALTPLGISQAEQCATRCAGLDVDVIFSSTYQRAFKTAEIIQQKNNKPIVKDEILLEYRYPDAVIGLTKKDGPNHLDMIGNIETRYPGGETFGDLNVRARAAMTLLEAREEKSILVVSHSFFLHAMLTAITFGGEATFCEFEKLVHTFMLSNTGITHCIFDDEKSPERKWRVITWNDEAHLV